MNIQLITYIMLDFIFGFIVRPQPLKDLHISSVPLTQNIPTTQTRGRTLHSVRSAFRKSPLVSDLMSASSDFLFADRADEQR